MAIVEILKTAYFRGRGAQRIRKVLRITLEEGDLYVPGIGFSAPGLLGINIQAQLLAPVRDSIVRTIEPRVMMTSDFGVSFESLYDGTHVILDFSTIDIINSILGPAWLRVRAFGIPAGGLGFGEGEEGPAPTDQGIFSVEIELTSNSGAEA